MQTTAHDSFRCRNRCCSHAQPHGLWRSSLHGTRFLGSRRHADGIKHGTVAVHQLGSSPWTPPPTSRGQCRLRRPGPSGAGSVSGMALDPVAVAASNNPILTT